MSHTESGVPPPHEASLADSASEDSAAAGRESVDEQSADWQIPPFQARRTIAALLLVAVGFALYEYVLASFWSSGWLGIYARTPYAAYAILTAALILALAGVRVSLGVWSPHLKLGLSLLALFVSIVIGVGGGRFVSYTLRGTLNPPFRVALARGDSFPGFALSDQHGALYQGPTSRSPDMTLIFIYRGDFCPFARFELSQLTKNVERLRRAGVEVVAISADPVARSRMLADFLRTSIPLLSDETESLLGPLGLVQHHRDGQPDSAIPAFFLVDRKGIVRWTFTSPYYRQMPRLAAILAAARAISGSPAGAERPEP